ncbi:MAG: hypothetical protein R2854_19480 [Caldilineaceae bacterium]
MAGSDRRRRSELIDAGAVVIDVCEEGEYAGGLPSSARSMCPFAPAQNLDKIPVHQPVLGLLRQRPSRSMSLGSLQALGYSNVRSFPGGWRAWSEAGEEVSTEANAGETYDVPEIDADLLAAVDGFLSNIPDGFLIVRTVEDLEAPRMRAPPSSTCASRRSTTPATSPTPSTSPCANWPRTWTRCRPTPP